MFTGIIESTGTVVSFQGSRLMVTARMDNPIMGESIAVNGVCLTLVDFDMATIAFDVSKETIQCTHMGRLKAGMSVHLERAVSAFGRFGGHFVSGHVDTTASLLWRSAEDDFLSIRVGPWLPEQLSYLVPKGSITLDGVSLTINTACLDWVDIMLVPHTLLVTHFNLLELGHLFNVEFDYLTRIVVHTMRQAFPLLQQETVTGEGL